MAESGRLPFRQRLYFQAARLTALNVDLRKYKSDDSLKEAVWLMREAQEAVFKASRWQAAFPHDQMVAAEWAIDRLRTRMGLESRTWFPEGEALEDHTQEADLRLVLEWLEAVE